MGVSDVLESIALIVVIASLGVGFYESSSDLGEMTVLLDQAIEAPLSFGPGLLCFTVSLDTWTPCIPVTSLPVWLQWLAVPYLYAGGEYIPHFSLWTALFALVVSCVVTFLVLHLTEIEFMYRGLLIAVVTFFVCWWLWHLITFFGIGWGANMMGLGSENAYSIWRNAVESTDGPLLQYFFFATIPLSIYLLYQKVATRLI